MKKVDDRQIEINYEEMEEYFLNLRMIDVKKKDKLTFCATHLQTVLAKKRKAYVREIERINLNLCSTNKETGDITMTAQGDFCFTPENLKKQKEQVEELNKKTITITVMKTPDLRRVRAITNPSLCVMFDGVLWDLPSDFWNEGADETSEEKQKESETKEA